MPTLTWQNYDLGFIETNNPTTMFLTENSTNSLYIFENNYFSFFTCLIDPSNNNPILDPQAQFTTTFIPPNTTFTTTSYTQSQINFVTNQILQGKLSIFQSNSENLINLITQNPSNFVQNNITPILSTTGLPTALSTNASTLIDPQFNFSINEIQNWKNGAKILGQISNALTLYQNNLVKIQSSVNSIVDFKKKLLRRSIVIADSIRKDQANLQTFNTNNTFGALENAFPTSFTKFNNVIKNSNTLSSTHLSNLLPQNIGTGNVQQVLSSTINSLFGNTIPQIISTPDKFLLDISNLENDTINSITSTITQGFASLTDQLNFINQVLNVCSNIVSKLPITPTIAIPTTSSNTQQINTSLTSFYQSQFQSAVTSTNATTPSQKTSNDLQTLMNSVGPPNLTIPLPSQNSDPNDPSQGGSIINTSIFQSLFNGEVDPSVSSPNLNISQDPFIAVQQLFNNLQQQQINQPGIIETPTNGNGYNVFEEIPLRPRNNPVNAEIGDYTINTKIDI